MSDIDWQCVSFRTEEQAQAFADGLTYGDEPKYVVDEVAKCRYPDHEGRDVWDVVFAYADEVEE